MAGYSRTPRNLKLMAPKSTIARDMTIASTGRLMLIEARLISGGSLLRGEGDGEDRAHCTVTWTGTPGRSCKIPVVITVSPADTVGDLDARGGAHAGTDRDRDNDPVPAQEERLPLEHRYDACVGTIKASSILRRRSSMCTNAPGKSFPAELPHRSRGAGGSPSKGRFSARWRRAFR
jgi:hypothetical protein